MQDPATVATYALILATLVTTYRGFHDARFTEAWIFDTFALRRPAALTRLVTPAFLHADWMHFGFNMLGLYLFGRELELAFGPLRFLAIYFIAAVGGHLLAFALNRRRRYRALGASGGVSGIVLAFVFLYPGARMLVFPFPTPIPSWLYAILFIAGSIYGIRKRGDNIGHEAHLGGALAGLFAATVFTPALFTRSPWLYLGVVAIAGGYLAYARLALRRFRG